MHQLRTRRKKRRTDGGGFNREVVEGGTCRLYSCYALAPAATGVAQLPRCTTEVCSVDSGALLADDNGELRHYRGGRPWLVLLRPAPPDVHPLRRLQQEAGAVRTQERPCLAAKGDDNVFQTSSVFAKSTGSRERSDSPYVTRRTSLSCPAESTRDWAIDVALTIPRSYRPSHNFERTGSPE